MPKRHQSSVGIYKAMGASLSHIRKLYYLHWSLLSVFSIMLGLLIGYVFAQLGFYAVQDYLPMQLSIDSVNDTHFSGLISLGFYPLIVAVFTGLLCALAFAITPLKELIATSALVVIRGGDLKLSNQKLIVRVGQFLAAIISIVLIAIRF